MSFTWQLLFDRRSINRYIFIFHIFIILFLLYNSSAYAGGDFKDQYMQKQQAVQHFYVQNAKPERKEEIKQEFKPDFFDNIYIGLRTYVDSWVLFGLIIIGFATLFRKRIRQVLLWVLGGEDKKK